MSSKNLVEQVNNYLLRSEGGYYTGPLLDNKPHGTGVIKWENGDMF